jgi:hypothetical protein
MDLAVNSDGMTHEQTPEIFCYWCYRNSLSQWFNHDTDFCYLN